MLCSTDFYPSYIHQKDKRNTLRQRISMNSCQRMSRGEVKVDFEELQPSDELRIMKSIQDLPTNLEMKPLPKHLEYAFLEENSLLPVVISALLRTNE
ncbi:hypothetical protein Tco_1385413 [Tanacetum coccineum]